MEIFNTDKPHRRYNQLTGEWILVSPHRTQRPWQGKEEYVQVSNIMEYDPSCYLCPGNKRAGGKENPIYDKTFAFTNDFTALLPELPLSNETDDGLLKIEGVNGTSRVVCFSPNHSLTLSRMPIKGILNVINTWSEQTAELGETYEWVQIFENKGEIMGCSNPHPHGQIWASNSLPNEAYKENKSQLEYYKKNNSNLLLDYINKEQGRKDRIVIENNDWIVIVPFWAIWPFETLLLPKKHKIRITDLNSLEKESLAEILKRHLIRYDNLFNISFPYTMGWHGAPFNKADNIHWQLHAHFYPPLLRSASIKKFMVGYEMLAEAQRDITAEQAALQLREQSEVHYIEEN